MAGAVAEPTFQLTFGADLRNSLVTSWGVTSSTRRARRPPWRKRRPWRAGVRPRAALPPALRSGARPGGRRHLQQRRIAMNVVGSFAYGGLLSGPFKPGVTLFPRDPAGAVRPATPPATPSPRARRTSPPAWEFVKWLVGDNGQEHLALTETTTPRRGLPPKDTPPEVTRVFFEALKTGLYFPLEGLQRDLHAAQQRAERLAQRQRALRPRLRQGRLRRQSPPGPVSLPCPRSRSASCTPSARPGPGPSGPP